MTVGVDSGLTQGIRIVAAVDIGEAAIRDSLVGSMETHKTHITAILRCPLLFNSISMHESPQAPSDRDEVHQLLLRIAELPIHLLARLAGKSVNSFLAAATGVSLARLSEGNLANIQQSTIDRGRKKVSETLKAKTLRNGCSPEDFDRLVTTPTITSTGTVALWLTFIESLDPWNRMGLTHTRNIALAFDELLVALIRSAQADDFQVFKDTLGGFFSCADLTSKHLKLDRSSSRLSAVARASNWHDALVHLNLSFDDLLLDVFAALDAEWSGQFFPAMEPRPLLLYLAPRINPVWDIGNAAHLKRNRIFRPTRRLLELLHSVMQCHLRGRWPESVPGRKDISDACGLDENSIGSFFDGTKKLSLGNCEAIWDGSFMLLNGKKSEPPLFPRPLAAIALSLEGLLVKQTKQYKLKELVLLDEDSYIRRWENHRLQLPTPEKAGSGKWPDWLTNQSLSSEFVRSSQSSGRSSSPRECQYSS